MKKVMLSAIQKPKMFYKKAKMAAMKKIKMAKMKKAEMSMKKPKFNAKLKSAAAQGKLDKNPKFKAAVMKAKMSMKKPKSTKKGVKGATAELARSKARDRARKLAKGDPKRYTKIFKSLTEGITKSPGGKGLVKQKSSVVKSKVKNNMKLKSKGGKKITKKFAGTKAESFVDEKGKVLKKAKLSMKKPKQTEEKEKRGKKKYSKGDYMLRG